ncbi:MAG: class I SAM-dependent methyltransferase [Thermoanaerobaculia bacterium]|jgi:SAM-dependent methyltransferase
MTDDSVDRKTADAFAASWNDLPAGSVYTRAQFTDWFDPVTPDDLRGRRVLELGFGNGSLLHHVAGCAPAVLTGVELGDTAGVTRANIPASYAGELTLIHGDLTRVDAGLHDVVYCIGVIHHLDEPVEGFRAVLRHVADGGCFHCWVYAREGNALVIALVDPLRRVASRLHWRVTKWGIALPLAFPFFVAAKATAALVNIRPSLRNVLPLADYFCWIAKREFAFFHHVAFDQLVTPTTRYIGRDTIDAWLGSSGIEQHSTYVIFRNGNSWKFGGRRKVE